MSVEITNVYSVAIPKDRASFWLSNMLASNINFEILDPRELGSKWNNLKFLDLNLQTSDPKEQKLQTILDNYQSKGFLSTFLDQRIKVDASKLQMVRENFQSMQKIVEDITKYKDLEELENKLISVWKDLNYQDKDIFFGQNVFNDLEKTKYSLDSDISSLEMFALSEGWSLILISPDDLIQLKNTLQNLNNTNLFSRKEFEQWLESSKQTLFASLNEFGYNPVSLTKENLQNLASYLAIIQLDKQSSKIGQHIFSLEEDSSLCFAFLAISNQSHEKFIQIVTAEDLKYEKIDWNKEIVVWQNSGSLSAFQGVAQALGTVDTKEADPSWSIAFFFSLFFAFCLGDAIYGLILVVFCGYLLYFANLKKQFKNIFRIFFFSGLATVVFGALTNSWAGDLFVNTPAKGFLESLQIINPLDANANVPINQLLKNNGGISPIVAMMGISLFIGVANIYTAYILKIITSIKSKDMKALSQDISWFGFVSSLLVLILLSFLNSPLVPLVQISLALFTVSLFIFNAGQGLIGKFMSGLVSIYNLIGFFADILSFTRLVAVGLTSGIIANVVNLLAGLIYVSIPVPVLGLLLAAAVLIGGHIFNLAVALFGAYINPLRLHYVEFMPKFFEGRGRNLKPIHPELTHLQIVD